MTTSPYNGSQPRRYKNPPIVEAICEIRFKLGRATGDDFRDLMRAHFTEEYSGPSRVLNSVNINVQQSDSGPPVVNQTESEDRLQLYDLSETRLVAFSPEVLSVHMLTPYHCPRIEGPSGWAEFRPRICRALSSYWNVVQPAGMMRISLRYLNKIALPAPTVSIQDFLTCAIANSSQLPNVVTNFISRTDFRYPDGVVLALSQGSIPTPDFQPAFLLDLDVIHTFARPSGLDLVAASLDDLRERERRAFEACITDQARELFDDSPN